MKANITTGYAWQFMDHGLDEVFVRKNAWEKIGDASNEDQRDTLRGGLYGLIGAPSIGKTTFAVQLADWLTSTGLDVLYYSMVEGIDELISKSLARLTAEKNIDDAVSSMSIWQDFDDSPAAIDAFEEYKRLVDDRETIITEVPDIRSIEDYIEKETDTAYDVAVILDSLQTIPLIDDQRKSVPDHLMPVNVLTRLKSISSRLRTPVIVLSDYCGESNPTLDSLSKMKDTDGIISCCDVIWSLQMDSQDSPLGEVKKPCRDMKLVCLKNRYGQAGYTVSYKYYPANDLFIQTDPPTIN